jgi:hypothetical protein
MEESGIWMLGVYPECGGTRDPLKIKAHFLNFSSVQGCD